GYVKRLPRRAEAVNGGSGAVVWQLGAAGWEFAGRTGHYKPRTSVDYHALAVVDSYLVAARLERLGVLPIDGYEVEHYVRSLRTDLLLKTTDALGVYAEAAIEMETTIKRRRTYIAEKCDLYCTEYESRNGGEFPRLIFLARYEIILPSIQRRLRDLKPRGFQ